MQREPGPSNIARHGYQLFAKYIGDDLISKHLGYCNLSNALFHQMKLRVSLSVMLMALFGCDRLNIWCFMVPERLNQTAGADDANPDSSLSGGG